MSGKSYICFVSILIMITCECNAQHLPGNNYDDGFILNPAFCGINTKCILRAGFHYNNQWGGNYTSNSFQADLSLRPQKNTNSSFGIGLSLTNQKSPKDLISINMAGISLAYHKVINHFIAHLGLTAMWQQKSLNTNDFNFASQWFQGSFDPSIASGETNLSESQTSFSLNCGSIAEVFFNNFPLTKIRAGIAGWYLNKPYESFTNSTFHYNSRILTHIDINIKISHGIDLMPFYMNYKGQSNSLKQYGANIGLSLKKNKENIQFTLGSALQSSPYKAIKFLIGAEYKNINLKAWYSLYNEGIINDYTNYNIAGFSLIYKTLCSRKNKKHSCLTPESNRFKRRTKWKK